MIFDLINLRLNLIISLVGVSMLINIDGLKEYYAKKYGVTASDVDVNIVSNNEANILVKYKLCNPVEFKLIDATIKLRDLK